MGTVDEDMLLSSSAVPLPDPVSLPAMRLLSLAATLFLSLSTGTADGTADELLLGDTGKGKTTLLGCYYFYAK
jgi:hypothetical protein